MVKIGNHLETSVKTCREFSAVVLPELLSPAGDWDCAKAAVENGADAIYFGLERFNARMRAHNFTEGDLPRLLEFLHRRGVKGYVTFNTLVFANELADAEQALRALIAAGVDAVIVQDVGICRLIRKLSPDFPIHASTQMTITSAAGVEFAKELGCQLVVLARECSLQEIGKMTAASATTEGNANGSRMTDHASLPLEVFVHGALCVAYSGQCLTSEALGGRSANRGECAQACRMPYELICDGKPVPLGDRRYLLSPQDLAGLAVLPELVRAGVASLKIEGRLKTPEYVANITRIYRTALDKLAEGSESKVQDLPPTERDPALHKLERRSPTRRVSVNCVRAGSETGAPAQFLAPLRAQPPTAGKPPLRPSPLNAQPFQYELEMAFSRGLYSGWFRGINNQELVHARFGKKRGVYLGEVIGINRGRIAVNLRGPLKPGDGVVFDSGHPDQEEEGGRVYEVQSPKSKVQSSQSEIRNPTNVELSFGRGCIDFRRVHIGDKVWKTSDPELDRRLRQSFAGDRPHFQRSLGFEIHGEAGQPMTVLARDELGHVAQAVSSMPLSPATTQPLVGERLWEQLGRLGGTPFRLGALTNRLDGDVMLPVSELNRLRRELVRELELQRARPRKWTMNPNPVRAKDVASESLRRGEAREKLAGSETESSQGAADRVPAATLNVLVRNLDQLEAVLRCGVQTVYCEFEDPKKYRAAVARFRAWQKDTALSLSAEEPETTRPPIANRQSPMTGQSPGPATGSPAVSQSAIFIAPPRVFKTGEEWILKQVHSCEADGYLVRNYDHLRYFAGCRCVGDYSLNVANPLAAEYFVERFGLERVTASYDLNVTQLEALLQNAPPEWFEITIHQHIPMFHMEHCVFCAFLSQGTDYTNCGRPCDRHEVRLRDRVGAEHPLKADAGCRNTVFNSLAQTGAEHLERLRALGAGVFRLEFLNETPDGVEQTIGAYRRVLRGEITGRQLWRELKLLNQLGVTRGTVGKV